MWFDALVISNVVGKFCYDFASIIFRSRMMMTMRIWVDEYSPTDPSIQYGYLVVFNV